MEIKKDLFPLLTKYPNLIYLDSAATALKPQVVIDKISEYYTNYGVNVNRGVYDLSQVATDKLEESRTLFAEFINAKSDEVIFTKGTTDSLNQIARMMDERITTNDEIMVSVLDHHSFIIPFQELAKRHNAKLTYVNLDKDFFIDSVDLKNKLNNKTKIVCLTYVSNVIGNIQNVKELTKTIKEFNKDIIVIIDAAQAAPHIKIDVKDINCDFLAFSLHKMLGPTGVGILYGKLNLLNKLYPTEFGGDMNDGVDKYTSTYKDAPHRYEAGTPNIEGVIASIPAVQMINEIGIENIHKHAKQLANYVIDQLKDDKDLTIYNMNSDTGIVTFNINNVHPHDTATFLASNGICVRAGHHCAQLITKYLGVIGTVRASFYIYNTMEDAEKFVKEVREAINYFKEWGL